jgi:hypothetical protein
MPQVVHLERAPGSALTLLSGRRHDRAIGTIAIPTRDHVSAPLFISLMNTDWRFMNSDEHVQWAVVQGNILTSQRNELVQRMMGDWILFIDSDMVFDTQAIGRLIQARDEHDLDILGGLCFQRIAPHQPTLYMRESPTEGGYAFMEKWDSDLVEVDGTGMAFIIIHRRVFERIVQTFENPDFAWPSYEERAQMRPPNFFRWMDGVGEDLRFCQDAKASGSRIFVDTRNPIGHVGEATYDYQSFLREIALREPEVEEARRRLNDQMGLETMTAAEARERLGW